MMIYVHLVFSTRERRNLLRKEDLCRLYPYMSRILQTTGCTPLRIGGTTNHVHVLFIMSKTETLPQIIKALKTKTTLWLKTVAPFYRLFSWQGGYGAFSVSKSVVHRVISYIDNQEEHHRKKTFEEELREIYERVGIPFNVEYI